jgi:hypothetical protein
MSSRKLTISDMRSLARSRGGRCLSDAYVHAHTKLTWQCAHSHTWEAKPNNIQQGGWCPVCGGTMRLTLNDMLAIARERKGKCLSRRYVNNRTNLSWECQHGHRWKASPQNIRAGKWCPSCAGNLSLTMRGMQSLARQRGGRCLSRVYINNQTKLRWRCVEGHTWWAIPNSIQRGTWCRVCAGLTKPTLVHLRNVAGERGGKCLSGNYQNARSKILWECAHDHRWKARWDKIRRGQWCPTCSSGLGERVCRAFFEQLLHKPFPKARPRWLINESGNRMELDGYSAKLNLAFEHQGEQHFSLSPPYSQTLKDLRQRRRDDRRKKKLCSEHGILLILVPEIPNRLGLEDVRHFLRTAFKKNAISMPPDFERRKIRLTDAYATPRAQAMLEGVRKIAQRRGGLCCSTQYAGDNIKLEWECAAGHRWKAVPSSVKQGSWCPYCAGTMRGTLTELQRVAEARGGRCLATRYVNTQTKVSWECDKGHRWQALPTHVKRGSWCPYCRGMYKSIKELREIAKLRGGKCLSRRYLGTHSKHLWRCSEGHEWKATFDSVRRGSWCPYCAGQGRTIDDIKALARDRGGACLSLRFEGMAVKLLWQCSQGHRWRAIPSSIRLGTWCPICRSTKLTIEQMRELAARRNGQCISKRYVNESAKLRWQCAAGHRWLAAPKHIKEGRWCPTCARRRRQRQ